MKSLVLSILFCLCSISLFAHIDRPIDALIFEGVTYDTYSEPLASYVKSDRNLLRKLQTNPVNARLPKHYYATFEIKDNKLYLNKIEIIKISEKSMRLWRFPLALTYTLEPLEANMLFGKGATYPIFCDWYSGSLYSRVFDGDRSLRYLFNENYAFKFDKGEFVGKKALSTRTVLSKYISFEEADLLYKNFEDKSFDSKNLLFDLRCITNLGLLNQDEYNIVAGGKAFKTRGYLKKNTKGAFYLYMPKTRLSLAQRLDLMNRVNHDISDFKEGDRVEATLLFNPNYYEKAGLLNLSHLADDEIIHSPDFFLRGGSKN